LLNIFWAIFSLYALLAIIFSAPINSVVSERIELHPYFINKSEVMPTAGFAVIPDAGSEPPHFKARVILLISNSSFFLVK
jgi:hypothetical protein